MAPQTLVFFLALALGGIAPVGGYAAGCVRERLELFLLSRGQVELASRLTPPLQDAPGFKPLAPEEITGVKKLSNQSNTYKITGARGSQVVRIEEERADPWLEAFRSAVFRALPATDASTVRVFPAGQNRALLLRIHELLPGPHAFSSYSAVSVGSFEEGTVGTRLLRGTHALEVFGKSGEAASSVSPELKRSIADLWATCRLLFVPDCHSGNWVAVGKEKKRAVAVDLAYPDFRGAQRQSNLWMQDSFDPVAPPHAWLQPLGPDEVRAILSWTSDELRESFRELKAEELKRIAQSVGYQLSGSVSADILKQRDRLLQAINEARK